MVVKSGYRGSPGELWFVRVLPPPIPPAYYWVVFTTPYVIIDPGVSEWQAYLKRTIPKIKAKDDLAAYEELLKFGLSRSHWNEYVFEAYANHQKEAIFLKGLPDVEESRPHSNSGYHSKE